MGQVKFRDTGTGMLINELLGMTDHRTSACFAADCAEHVLRYFTDHLPEDDRPGKAIEAGRAWVKGEISVGEARKAAFASHAAARETDGPAAAAARAAGHAAATAHMKRHAVPAAFYAVKSAFYAGIDTDMERTWQYQKLLEICKGGK